MAKIFQPTVVIGIGGTGKGIILALKKMIAENCKNGMSDFPFLKFLSVDTDISSPVTTSSIKTIKESELTLNKEKETFGLHANFNVVPDLKNDFPEIDDWFPSSLQYNLTPAELEKGAGQKKPIGRFTFAWNANELYTKLSNLLRNPVDVLTAKEFSVGTNLSNFTNVFICGSICGGTGAGTFLDVAYMVRHIQSTLATGRQIYIYGMFALSTLFEGIAGDANIKPNCYASLVELDHFMNQYNFENPFRRFHPAYKNYRYDYSRSSKIGPFDFPFLFDKSNDHFALNSSDNFNEMCARFIYLLTGHEVADVWQSMDNNVRKNLDTTYKKELLDKPINYRSMGTYSIMFPRRMVTQICAYKLANEYFKRILNDDDTGDQIDRIAERFMDDVKVNPNKESLKNSFDYYYGEDTAVGESFSEYIENCKNSIIDQLAEEDKKEIVTKVREWKEEMDKKVGLFRQQNSDKALKLRKSFLEQLYIKIGDTLDLALKPDAANPDPISHQPRMVRGSIVRIQKVLTSLIDVYTNTAENLRREEESTAASIKNYAANFDSALNDLEKTTDSILATKGKIADGVNTVIGIATDYLNTKRENLICNWARQFLTGILENNIPRESGIIKELENRCKIITKGINDFREISGEVENYLETHKRYDANLCDIIFDYKTDVEGVYNQIIQEQSEDTLFTSLSDKLRKEGIFGSAYEKLEFDDKSQITLNLLSSTEDYFFDPVSKIKISDKIMNTPDKLDLLLNGNYYNNANVYLGLNGSEMARVDLSTESTTFSAITIPDDYEGLPCMNIKGSLSNVANPICPQDAEPENYRGENACPLYGKCLKKVILENAPRHLAIVPTSETAEINIVNTIAGYPLHAVNTAATIKQYYDQIKEKNAREQEGKSEVEEKLHMFGPVAFTDLFEKTEDPRKLTNGFREILIFALGVRRLLVEDNKVSFYTQRDKQMHLDSPSLVLGISMDQVMDRFMSTRKTDIQMVKQITEEMEFFKDVMKGNPTVNAKAAEVIKATFEEISKELPRGLKLEDLDLLNKVSVELCNQKLVQDEGPIDWF